MNIFKDFKGVLFIGDPHMGSRSPSTRLDEAFNITVEKKLIEAAQICNKKKLFPIITGDLVDRNNDYQPQLWYSLANALRAFDEPPVMILGNHDKNHDRLTKEDVLFVFKELDLIRIMPANGFWGRIDCFNETKTKTDEFSVYLGGTQNGNQIPKTVEKKLNTFKEKINKKEEAKPNEMVVWLSHHDINFLKSQSWYVENGKEGDVDKAILKEQERIESMPTPFEIKGVDWIVNGHIHKTFEPVNCGQTKWSNPGNITRRKISEKNHIPQVWEWTANKNSFENKKLKPHKLTYEKDIFRTVINEVEVLDVQEFSSDSFVSELKQDMKEVKTRDASLLRESINDLFEENETNNKNKAIINHLFDSVENNLK